MKIKSLVTAIVIVVGLNFSIPAHISWAQQPSPPSKRAGDMNDWVTHVREEECTGESSHSQGEYEILTVSDKLCRWGMSIVALDRQDVNRGAWLTITTNFVPSTYQISQSSMVMTEPILLSEVNHVQHVYKLPIMALGKHQYQVQIPDSLSPGVYQVSFRHVLLQHRQNGRIVSIILDQIDGFTSVRVR